ncbi:ATP-binding cassette domain-containing protein [Halobacillus litoralis]|uniref:ribosomal protection-like ABC-F family protein n=1 Tax=Halobacillus litoralis TaxID=45668 RepID=UPI001CD56E77|nr:ATP-binding cassette domain-containing protein [Halobacillus litoralis]MCA0969723.1 ATP-binding cassette domain-containing protein [Halobacillus litoralis]
MLMMKGSNIEYSIADRTIFSIPELSIHSGDRIGLIGKNGQGKTLLLRYLLNQLDDEPQVQWWTEVSWMEQLSGEGDPKKSGGEKTLADLERLFEASSPLLFLDEPTNNLDWTHIDQLEERMAAHKGAYVIVSHDRQLLDNVCDRIWELEDGELTSYDGNYSFYEQAKEQERQQQQQKYEQYVNEKKRLEERVRKKNEQSKQMRKPPKRMGNSEWQLGKNKAATKQGKVERVSKTLERRLNRLDKVEKPFEWDQVKMNHSLAQTLSSKTVMSWRDTTVYAGDKLLFHIEQAEIPTGSKLALIGDNGSGKTTWIQNLMRDAASSLDIAYFNQDLTTMPLDTTVLEYVGEGSPLKESDIRIVLGRLRFFADDMNKQVRMLSGGERVKLALARLLTRQSHLLILDEPTNHLDLEAIQSLESLITDYPGTILFVSHDRTFVERTADQLWVIEKGELDHFRGTLQEWREPKPKEADEFDRMKLQNKLTEIISRLSLLAPHEDKTDLENEYHDTLKKLRDTK